MHGHLLKMKSIKINKDIYLLAGLKIIFSVFVYFVLSTIFNYNIFSYPDFLSTYSNCTQSYTNIFYTKFLCGIELFLNKPITPESLVLIILSGTINIFVLIYYFYYFRNFLTRNGQIILILLYAFHPYMAVYFFRFYTDIFATIGILLIFNHIVKNKEINILFLFLAFVLMGFRNALIPVFFSFSVFEIIKFYLSKKSVKIMPICLMLISILSYLPSISFSQAYSNMYENFNIFSNFIYTFGFRESIAIGGLFSMLELGKIGYFEIFVSLFLLIIHLLGLIGTFKFSIKINPSLMICFIYLIIPIIVISHMRYLLPLIPILGFGFVYLFYSKTQSREYYNDIT